MLVLSVYFCKHQAPWDRAAFLEIKIERALDYCRKELGSRPDSKSPWSCFIFYLSHFQLPRPGLWAPHPFTVLPSEDRTAAGLTSVVFIGLRVLGNQGPTAACEAGAASSSSAVL